MQQADAGCQAGATRIAWIRGGGTSFKVGGGQILEVKNGDAGGCLWPLQKLEIF